MRIKSPLPSRPRISSKLYISVSGHFRRTGWSLSPTPGSTHWTTFLLSGYLSRIRNHFTHAVAMAFFASCRRASVPLIQCDWVVSETQPVIRAARSGRTPSCGPVSFQGRIVLLYHYSQHSGGQRKSLSRRRVSRSATRQTAVDHRGANFARVNPGTRSLRTCIQY